MKVQFGSIIFCAAIGTVSTYSACTARADVLTPATAGAPVGHAPALPAPAEPSASAPTPPSTGAPATAEPFAFADFTWLNGNSRQTEFPLDAKVFTGEFTLDTNYVYDFANPADHTIVGSTNTGRSGEVQVEQLGVGGDFHYQNVRGRVFTQFGMYSTMTPRNDSSPARGQWDLTDAYRYISEAYGGYHWDTWNGINLDVGIFMSYIGLCSYYNYENWVYQMSYVSANTPWFFNGIRLQTFPSDKLKLEYWLINGWQSYGMFNEAPGVGAQVLWRPVDWFSLVSNSYVGHDTLLNASRIRLHSDNSVQVKYWDKPTRTVSKAALSFTLDFGCENGGGVTCDGSSAPPQYFIGLMAYNRFWFLHDKFGLTLGGGAITNPGRYLVLTPPVNGATANNNAAPYFTQQPGDSFVAWDTSITADYMPSQFITFRLEFIHRHANVPYFAGAGGVTPGEVSPGQLPNGSNVAGAAPTNWAPDLQQDDNRINAALMVRI